MKSYSLLLVGLFFVAQTGYAQPTQCPDNFNAGMKGSVKPTFVPTVPDGWRPSLPHGKNEIGNFPEAYQFKSVSWDSKQGVMSCLYTYASARSHASIYLNYSAPIPSNVVIPQNSNWTDLFGVYLCQGASQENCIWQYQN